MKILEEKEFNEMNVFGKGKENVAYANYFTGASFINTLVEGEKDFFLDNVTFEPGCSNNWHVHHTSGSFGQILICTAGEGWYQQEGKEAISLTPGTVIKIPGNVKHWHGAKKDSWFSHIALEVIHEGDSNEWLEAVSDDDYNAL